MNKLLYFVIFLVVLLSTITVYSKNVSAKIDDGILDLSNIDKLEVIELTGEWHLFPNKFVPPKNIKNETDYVTIDVPTTWENVMYKGSYISPQSFNTYYLKIILPEDIDVFSLYIPDISSCYRLYINNDLITQMGIPSDSKDKEVGKWKPTVVTYAPDSNIVELVLQVSNFHHNDGGIWESIKIGPVKDIYFLRIIGLIRGILLCGILFAFTYYFINFYFVVKPKNHSTLYLALACIFAFIRELVTKDVPLQFLYDSFPFRSQVALEYISLCGLTIVFTEYVLYNFNDNKYIIYIKRLLDVFLLTIIGIIIFSPMVYYTSLVVLIQVAVIGNLLLIVFVTINAVIHKSKEAFILIIGSLLLLFFGSLEMAFINRFFEKSILFDMGIVVFILFLLLLVHLHNQLTNKAFNEASISKNRKLAFLRAQIVPHFINNALSNAIYLTENNPIQAKEFLIELSNLMVNKYNFNLKDSLQEIPLKKELEIIRSYVYIQNIRFNNKISYIEQIDERTKEITIPPLLIQPLVENAITHGLANNDKPISKLILTTSIDNNFLNIRVEDNGLGISTQKLIELESSIFDEYKGIGINNIKERISNIKGSSFHISSKLGVSTIVSIKIKLNT